MKHGYTLAEVLITLVVIGVVAAMTLPTLINKYREKELVTRYKRVYSLINQAYMRAIADNGGPANTWDDMYETALYEKIKPYLKISADCPANSNASKRLKCVGTTEYFLQSYKTLANTSVSLANFYKWPSIRLVTGEFIVFPSTGVGASFMTDLNGNAGPNQLGVDFHYFSFDSKYYNRIIPGAPWEWMKTKDDQAGRCDRTKTDAWGPGSSCGYWIIKHNNMDYLHIPIDEVYSKW